MAGAVAGQIDAMKIREGLQKCYRVQFQGVVGGTREIWRVKDGTVVGEADQAGVEGGVPQG